MPKKRLATRATSAPSARQFTSLEVPLYYQLAGVLQVQVRKGRYAAGDRIPTEAELVGEYGVSRITVRQALASLEQEGLVRREVGRGTFVNEHRPFVGELKVEGSLDDLISVGLYTSVKLLSSRTVLASRDDADKLGLV